MSESQPSKVYLSAGEDPDMDRAHQHARATFRYFWREIAWERRRIVPALDLACVKAPFSDGPNRSTRADAPDVEHMWLSDVDFDGRQISGTLLNSPNWLTSVKEGDSVRLPLAEISDWMFAIGGEVYGAYTVNLMRSRMSSRERQEHDDAWGLDFGDPRNIRLNPEANKGGLLKRWFGKPEPPPEEHPMSVAMAAKVKEQLARDPSMTSSKNDDGWTLLHQESLAGNATIVELLLAAGANPRAVTENGMTPLELAQSLGWERVVALLHGK
jgi:uncharacterized protein YegJ (DUF2314 family)